MKSRISHKTFRPHKNASRTIAILSQLGLPVPLDHIWGQTLQSVLYYMKLSKFMRKNIPGTTCKECLVLRCYRSPEYICGLTLIDKDGKYGYKPRVKSSHSRGFSFIGALQEKNPDFGNMVVVTNPLLALHTHATHFTTADDWLPVVGYDTTTPSIDFDYSEDLVWKNYADYDYVFLTDHLTSGILRVAAKLDAKISFTYDNPPPVPKVKILKAIEHSKNWYTAFVDYAKHVDDAELAEIIRFAHLDVVTKETVIRSLPAERAESICDILNITPSATVIVNGVKIRQTVDGWFIQNKLLTNAIITIDRMAITNTHPHCVGEIHYKGAKIPFHAYVKCMTKEWIFEKIAKLNMPAPLMAITQGYLFQIAQTLSKPILTTPDKLGWNKFTRELVLPQFKIDRNGQIIKTPALIVAQLLAQQIPPTPINTIPTVFQNNSWVSMFMHIALAYMTRAIFTAVEFDQPPPRLAIIDLDSKRILTHIFREFGCPQLNYSKVARPRPSEDWPVASLDTPNTADAILDICLNKRWPIVAATTETDAKILANHGWTTLIPIWPQPLFESCEDIKTYATAMLVSWLRYYCKEVMRKNPTTANSPDAPPDIVTSLLRWTCAELTGDQYMVVKSVTE